MLRLRRIGTTLVAIGAALVVLYSLRALADAGDASVASFFNMYVYDTITGLAAVASILRVVVPSRDRIVWVAVAAACTSSWLGDILGDFILSDASVPSLADVGWQGLSVFMLIALVLLDRSERHERPSVGQWADAALTALAVGTILSAIVLEQALRAADHETTAALVTNLSYPVEDVAMVALAVGIVALRGWQMTRPFALLLVGVLCQTVADGLQVVGINWSDASLGDIGWFAAVLFFAAAGWSTRSRAPVTVRRAELVVPFLAGTLAVTALGLAAFEVFNLNPATLCLAIATLVATLVRMAVSLAENHRVLTGSRREAMTDPVTGLGNRRKLMADLRAAEGERLTLTMFDLNGFKTYNDTYGHAAGDALLERIGRALESAVETEGGAYRMGGDEFSVLTLADTGPASTALAEAIVQRGDGFLVSAAHGSAVIPDEATSADAALRLADRRMYADKHGGRRSADEQVVETLLAVMQERSPALAAHSRRVASLAERGATKLGLPAADRRTLRVAALLHDIGMLAVPEPVLAKRGRLTDDEWTMIHQHCVAGERVLSAAANLGPAAEIVRASHERWDGRGYPDGLTGEAIPHGARLLFVCDAYDAMRRDRSHAPARSHTAAVAELQRSAGSQFDPAMVDAVIAVLSEPAAQPPPLQDRLATVSRSSPPARR